MCDPPSKEQYEIGLGKISRIVDVSISVEIVAHMIKRHVKKNQQNPNGAIIEREGTVHISNVMKANLFDASAKRAKAAPANAE